MAEFVDFDGASASDGATADYSYRFSHNVLPAGSDSYLFIRSAQAINDARATMAYNQMYVYGSQGADSVAINATLSAQYGSTAESFYNRYFLDSGDGNDNIVVHTSISANSDEARSVSEGDFFTVNGGGGNDVLTVTQNFSAIVGASVRVADSQHSVDGGSGYDTLRVAITAKAGFDPMFGGSIELIGNRLAADTGADGGRILGMHSVTALSGGSVTAIGNHVEYLGGATGYSNILAGTTMVAGAAGSYSGYISWVQNSLSVSAGAQGAFVTAQDNLTTKNGSQILFYGNSSTFQGAGGSDQFQVGVIATAISGRITVEANDIVSDGGAGNDFLYSYFNGSVDSGGEVFITNNRYTGIGGSGNDSFDLQWYAVGSLGYAEVSSNVALLDGGAGSDEIGAYLGEGTRFNQVVIAGGDGDDYIRTSDWGIGNDRVISGGAGNDTIVDEYGFGIVYFDGELADYTITGLGNGQIRVVDNRSGSPDGADLLQDVNLLRFYDGEVNAADVPVNGTAGNDTIRGSYESDLIYGLDGDDTLNGRGGDDRLYGGNGNDTLLGGSENDVLFGDNGNDVLTGGFGSDELHGGSGADRFVMNLEAGVSDTIYDFSGQVFYANGGQANGRRTPGEGDKIDLTGIDANTNVAGDQAFTIVQNQFSGAAGEVYAAYDAQSGMTNIYLDVNGDAIADSIIYLIGNIPITGSDLIL